MGTALPKVFKRMAEKLVEEFPEEIGDFEKNKKVIDRMNLPFTKKMRNLIAGQMVRLIKKMKKERKSFA